MGQHRGLLPACRTAGGDKGRRQPESSRPRASPQRRAAAPPRRPRASASPAPPSGCGRIRRATRRKKGQKEGNGDPPVSAAAPGSGSGCPRAVPLGAGSPRAAQPSSPPRHTRWRRSGATSVPARGAAWVTEDARGAGIRVNPAHHLTTPNQRPRPFRCGV